MTTIVTRAGKGSPLTWNEVDNNFTNLNNAKYESGNNASFGTISGTTITASSGFSGALNGTVGASTPAAGTFTSLSYSSTLTGGTGVVNLGSGQFYKDASGNVGIGLTPSVKLDVSSTVRVRASGSTDSIFAFSRDDTGSNGWIGIPNWASTSMYILVPTTTGNQTGMQYNGSSNFWAFSTASSERMRIDSSGNVGIGTSSPSTKLQVSSGQSATAITSTTTSQASYVLLNNSADSSNAYVYATGKELRLSQADASASSIITAFTQNTERMRITSSGNVGIGTSSPGARLQINFTTSGNEVNFFRAQDMANGQEYSLRGEDSSGRRINTYISPDGSTPVRVLQQAASLTAFYTANTERMRIDSSGNVVIGSTETSVFTGVAGTGKLVVTGSNSATDPANNKDSCIVIANTDDTTNNTAALHFAWQDTDNTPNFASASIVGILGAKVANQYASGQIAFLTSSATNNAPSEKMRIDSSGNVLVGTTSSSDNTNGAKLEPGAPTRLKIMKTATGGTNGILFYQAGVYQGGLNFGDGSTSLATSSDKRLKENISDSPSVLDKINSIKIRSFDWKDSKETVVYGFIAQELNQILPEAVAIGKDTPEGDIEMPWAVTSTNLIPHLVKAIQEQQELINDLTTRLTALEGK